MDEKANIIKNFPIPNAKEDLLELLAMATSNAYDNDGIIGKEEEVWLQKADQIYQKIIVCAANDDAILEQASNMIFSLMKRLPREYKSFTSIPLNLKRKYEEELQADKNHKAEQKKSVFIKFGASGIGVIILGVIVFFRGLQYGWTPLLIGLGLLIAGIILVNKWKKEKRDIDTYFN